MGGQTSPDIPEGVQRQQAIARRAAVAKAAPPAIAPQPSPIPTEVSPIATAQERRRKKIRAARYGILSTIKTSPLGIVGTGSNLIAGGKAALGT